MYYINNYIIYSIIQDSFWSIYSIPFAALDAKHGMMSETDFLFSSHYLFEEKWKFNQKLQYHIMHNVITVSTEALSLLL